MIVTVEYWTQLNRAAGISSETVAFPEDCLTLAELLRRLADRHGPGFRALVLDEQQQPRRICLAFIPTGRLLPTDSIPTGQTVSLLYPMAGG
ncbi:MAG: hypothetical protein WCI73_01875 [Phycisphaerae bacterium]